MDIFSIITIGGLAMIAIGLLGGGIEVEKFKVPTIPTRARVLTIVTGVALLLLSLYISPQSPFNPTNTANMRATQMSMEATASFANSPTQDAAVQPVATSNAISSPSIATDLVLAESTFDSDPDGWLSIEAGSDGITYKPSGGVSGGYIELGDDEGNSYWIAPEKFVHDKSRAYGGVLLFSLKTSVLTPGELFDASQVVLIGSNGVVLAYNTTATPSAAWTTYTIELSESANWVSNSTGQKATKDELVQVLSALSELRIRGEFYRGIYDFGHLDNVIMLGQP